MINLLRIATLTLTTLVAVMAPAILFAEINWQDKANFPAELFPAIEQKTPDEVTLAGLAALYPGRLTRTPPTAPVAPVSPRKPVLATLPNKVSYLRCYNTTLDIELPAKQALIVDLRYFSTAPDSIAACLSFSGKLFGTIPRLKTIGTYPLPNLDLKINGHPPPKIVVLVNRQTSGPIEAILADLQALGKIMLVGSPTAGATANYQPVENASGWWRIIGEIQTETNGTSLVAIGITPQVRVAVPPENDLLAWQWIERGASPETILRLTQTNGTNVEKKSATANKTDGTDHTENIVGTDLVFQRGHDILAALQVMEGITASAQ